MEGGLHDWQAAGCGPLLGEVASQALWLDDVSSSASQMDQAGDCAHSWVGSLTWLPGWVKLLVVQELGRAICWSQLLGETVGWAVF